MTTKRFSQKPTISDVAALSGVGRSTVSRVLSNSPNVSDDVRARVLRAVEKTNYRVNLQARVLAKGQTPSLCWVLPIDIDVEPNSFYNAMIEIGAFRAAAEAGFILNLRPLYPNSPNKAEIIRDLILHQGALGLVLTSPFSDDCALIGQALSLNVPIIAIGAGKNGRALIDGVGLDDEKASHDLTTHLLEKGHQKFAFVHGAPNDASSQLRFDGFCRALSEAGLDLESVAIFHGSYNFRTGSEIGLEILRGSELPSAIVCANDDMAAGVIFRLHESGISVPKDISVTGFDDAPIASVLWPPLTTVKQPVKRIAKRAIELLISRLSHPKSVRAAPVFETFDHQLIIRASTGTPSKSLNNVSKKNSLTF